jgi:hypothetical protein
MDYSLTIASDLASRFAPALEREFRVGVCWRLYELMAFEVEGGGREGDFSRPRRRRWLGIAPPHSVRGLIVGGKTPDTLLEGKYYKHDM